MPRPVVGVIGNSHLINGNYTVYGGSASTCSAVRNVAGCTPLIVPTNPEFVHTDDLIEACDGFVFTGGRSNIHPELYGDDLTDAHGTMDPERDEVALKLIHRLTERGQPYFGICRGFQEVAVAFGATLHPEIRDLPGRFNHRMPPDGTPEEIRELRQKVTFAKGGVFHDLLGQETVMTNTLHGQGVMETGERVVIDGWADDGTPEALYLKDAPGFTLSVQWHPELNAEDDWVSQRLFHAFSEAVHAWADGDRAPLLKSA
ncbi:MAG: gamma-glutamyl-gamma-aminobutyrate hydrolase family protein [Pseudomonadota bacterium]